MQRWVTVLAIFFLGVGSAFLVNSSVFTKKLPASTKPIEITREATSTATLDTASGQETATVTRVIDGDTVELSDARKVRYIGIDTPEVVDPRKPVECFGREAKEENKRLVEGKTVRLEKDISETDKYGRLLRYVYIDLPAQAGDIMVNESLIRHGFAYASTYPPDVKYQKRFLEAEQEAQKNNRGLWFGCQSTPTIQQFNPSTSLGVGSTTISPRVEEGIRSGCTIKGNISSSGEKIYHLPGCGSYTKTSIDELKGERWFCTEEEAVKAGWRKAKNC